MTDKQVARYTELVLRRMFIILHSGSDWKPEYEEELKQIDKELEKLRHLVMQEHKRREKMKNDSADNGND